MDLRPGRPLSTSELVERLQEARARTLLLVSPLSEEDLRRQHDRLMSPIVWDLGHIGHFEEVWLLERLRSGGGEGEGLRGIYDPFGNPRAVRDRLPLPTASAVLAQLADVRARVLAALDEEPAPGSRELLQEGYVHRMVLQHEYQHDETILQTLQLKQGAPYRAPRGLAVPDPAPGATPPAGSMIRIPGGEFELGTDDRSEAYDNERPRHRVTLLPYWIDATPVTCGEYLRFMGDGGYERPELWSPAGRAWLETASARAPAYWHEEAGRWFERVMDLVREVDPRRPVCHVCYHEAEAWARWAGKRLPTEAEWETAACWDPATGARRRFPWGEEPAGPHLANVDVLTFDRAPVGAYPQNVSPCGCYGMIGDVWEWTASDFVGYPGFRAFPYAEYSEVFFGSEYKVLRGGSWATRPGVARTTFRNWDYPVRRQIFAGFRCARDA